MPRLLLALALAAFSVQLPAFSQGPKKLLFLTHAALYKHTSLGPAEKAVTELGKTGGYEVTTVEGYKQDPKQLDFSFLTPEYLNQFDGVMMMTNGNLPMTDAQKKMLTEFVRGGKALIGAHCASLTFYNYPEFGEMLGGYFNRNLPQGTIAVLKVEDGKHPATKMLESARAQAMRLLECFGLTPRSRLSIDMAPAPSPNAFSHNGQRRPLQRYMAQKAWE